MAKTGRNSPCPCGSGKKFKYCCAGTRKVEPQLPSPVHSPAPASQDPARIGQLGYHYLTGNGLTPDPDRGIAMIEQAARTGDAQSAYLAASINSSFFWRERNWETALDFLASAAELGHPAAQSSLQIIASEPLASPQKSRDWKGIRKGIDLQPWLEPASTRVISESPLIQIIANFVSAEVCDWLKTQAQGSLSRATIYDKATGGNTEDERRTNTHCDLGIDKCGVLTFLIRARINAITGKQDRSMEIPKILHYFPGETFARHYDYLNPNEPAYANEIAQRGQRTNTFLLYLNDDYEGGETHFYEIELSHKGKKGDAILFKNVDEQGQPDEMTMHAGLPPITGEKWIFSQWIRG